MSSDETAPLAVLFGRVNFIYDLSNYTKIPDAATTQVDNPPVVPGSFEHVRGVSRCTDPMCSKRSGRFFSIFDQKTFFVSGISPQKIEMVLNIRLNPDLAFA
jgi:hypothetical protein